MTKAKCWTRKRDNGSKYVTCDDKTKTKSKHSIKTMLGEVDAIEPLDNDFGLPISGKGTFESPIKTRKVKLEGAIPDPVKPGPRRSQRIAARPPIPKALNLVKPLAACPGNTMFNVDMKPNRKRNPKYMAPKQRSSDSLFEQVSRIEPEYAARHEKIFGKGGPLTVSASMLPPKKVKKKKPAGMSNAVWSLMS